MDNSFLITAFYFFSYVADGIFSGIKIVVPLVLLLKIFKANTRNPDLDILINSLNILLLTGSLLFLISMLINFYRVTIADDPMERDFMMALATGQNWYQMAIPSIVYAILPNLLWFNKLRKTIYSSGLIVLCWFITFYAVEYFSYRNDDYIFKHARPIKIPVEITSEKSIVFILLLLVIYMVIHYKRKKNNS